MSKSNSIKSAINSAIKGASQGNSLSRKIEVISTSLKSNPTIIARDMKINGEIVTHGLVEIEGDISGVVRGGSIILHEDGVINDCELMADYVSLSGQFNGNIKAANVNITGKARVTGVIEYSVLSVEDGACIDGQFKQVSMKK